MGKNQSEERGKCWMDPPSGATLWALLDPTGHPVAQGGKGAAGATLHMVHPRVFHRATELAASSLELLLHPPRITARLAKWHYDASFHLGHGPVFRVEAVNAMAPHSLGFGVNSINCSLPTPPEEVLPTGSLSPCLSTTTDCQLVFLALRSVPHLAVLPSGAHLRC